MNDITSLATAGRRGDWPAACQTGLHSRPRAPLRRWVWPDMTADPVTIEVDDAHTVSGLLQTPEHAFACCVLAHGAGAGMTHRFMVAVADGLAERDIATLRYQFPYMEAGSKRPDRPSLAHATVRAAVAAATRLAPGLPLFAGGKSFGARMTSQTQAAAPLPDVRGLIFLGFPLHPANKPSDERARHLADVHHPDAVRARDTRRPGGHAVAASYGRCAGYTRDVETARSG